MITATITRPNLGSLAYIWIGDNEYVAATTSEAHAILNRRGHVTFTHRDAYGVEHYTIERKTK